MKTVTIYLAEQQIEALDQLAQRTGIQRSEHIRRAIDQYVRQERKEPVGEKPLPAHS